MTTAPAYANPFLSPVCFISRITAREIEQDKRRTYVGACGKVNPPLYTSTAKAVTCLECKRNMLPEERR